MIVKALVICLCFVHRCIGYLKKVIDSMKERNVEADEIKAFQTRVQGYYKNVIAPNIKDFDFYAGESMNNDGMYVSLQLEYLTSKYAVYGLTGARVVGSYS